MKVKSVPGDFGFLAAFKDHHGWALTKHYFFTEEEATDYFTRSCGQGQHDVMEFKWPVSMEIDGFIYIPSKEELEIEPI